MNAEKAKSGGRRPHDEVRKAALEAAELIVIEEGLAGLSARRVAAEAGCSVGTLYNIFGDLDGLIDEVNLITLRHMMEQASKTVAQMAPAAGREERLVALAKMYLHYARRHRNRWRAVFEPRGQGGADPRRAQMEQLIFSRIVTAAGIRPAEVDPGEVDSLRMLLAAVHGVVTFAVNRTIPAQDAERYVTMIVQAGVRGYRDMVAEGLL